MARARPSSPPDPLDRLVGAAPALQTLRAQIRHLARFDAVGHAAVPTVLLQGETGTGKGLVARLIHDSGPRAQGPFIEVNCAAIPDTLLEAELFGVEAGAFTDAKHAKPGLFEAASGGTLFLDEIDALPLALQGKCLTAIEAKRVRRVGAVVEHPLDVKLIAATQVALSGQVQAGHFRADLYHRLAVVVLALPPLRARGDDILVLARAFLQQYGAAYGVSRQRLSQAAEAWLLGLSLAGQCAGIEPSAGAGGPARVGNGDRSRELGATVSAAAGTGRPCRHAAPPNPGRAPARARAPHRRLASERGQSRAGGPPVGDEPRRLTVPPAHVWPCSSAPACIPRPWRGRRAVGGTPHRPVPRTPPSPQPGERSRQGCPRPRGERPRVRGRQPVETNARVGLRPGESPAPAAGWAPKPVAVLAIEATWPEMSEAEARPYEPWTIASRWEQSMAEKVAGFGGVVLQGSPALCLVAFGLPRTLEQLPQRAVQAALAIRHLAAERRPRWTHGWPGGPAGRACGHAAGRGGDRRALRGAGWRWGRPWPCRCGCSGMRRRGSCWCPPRWRG